MVNTNTAVILAAGRGSRLKELSLENPKPMTLLHHDTIIDNLVSLLIANHFERIVVVIGYMAEKMRSHLAVQFGMRSDLIFIENPVFDTTNNIYSLWLAREYLRDNFYLFEADVYCDHKVIARLTGHPAENIMLVDHHQPGMDGTVVTLHPDGQVHRMILKKDQGNGFDYRPTFKTINFYRLSGSLSRAYLLPKLDEHIQGKDVGSYYEQIIKESLDEGYIYSGLTPDGGLWWEIDTQEDLQKAREMFNPVPKQA